MGNPFLVAALTYAGRGWAVFPCEPRRKEPLGKLAPRGVLDATTDEATIREWWGKAPTANVGIATGRSGLAVLDADGPEGEASLIAWQADHGALPYTVIAYTGSGGRHFLFKAPDGAGLRPGRNVLGDGSKVDLRASESYIVAPPSIHPNGKRYEWDDEAHPAEVATAELPKPLLSKLRGDGDRKAPVSELPDTIYDGEGREDALVRQAGYLRRGGLTEGEIYAALAAFNEARIRPPKPEKDLRRIAKSVMRYDPEPDNQAEEADAVSDLLPGATLPNRATFTDSVNEPVPATTEQAENENPWPEFKGDDLAAAPDVELNFLPVLGEPGWVVSGWSHLLSGFVRSGKTEFLTRAVQEWVNDRKRVYWLSEEAAFVWTLRLREIEAEWGYLTVRPAMGMPVGDMMRQAMTAPGDVLIVDSIRNLLGIKDENDNAEMAAAVRPWVSNARRAEKTLILTHHSRKGGGEHGEGVSGGHGLISVIDVILEVSRDKTAENRRVLTNLARIVPSKQEVYELDGGIMRFLGSPQGLAMRELKGRAFSALNDPDPDYWVPTAELLDRLGPPKPDAHDLRMALNSLVEESRVEREGATKATRWRRARILV